MKYLIITILLLASIKSDCQKLDFFGGVTSIGFYDNGNDDGVYTNYSSQPNFMFGLGLDDFKLKGLPLRISLSYENYEGTASASSGGFGGFGGSSFTFANTTKSLFSIGIYPALIKFSDDLRLDIGVHTSFLVLESVSGTTSSGSTSPPAILLLDDSDENFNASTYLGLQTIFKYDTNPTPDIVLSPFYSLYIGFLDEFDIFPKPTKSIRHSIGIRIGYE